MPSVPAVAVPPLAVAYGTMMVAPGAPVRVTVIVALTVPVSGSLTL